MSKNNKMNVHFSSKSNEWTTPNDLYNNLDQVFNFTLDPCATHENHKCDKYFTIEDNGILQSWANENVFMNPPYAREIKDWIAKAYRESLNGAIVVCLVPARTDTRYWHDYIFPYAESIIYLKGRLKFGGSTNSAPFPSAIVVFDDKKRKLKELLEGE